MKEVPATSLVPGDIVLLEEGDAVPGGRQADRGRQHAGGQLRVDGRVEADPQGRHGRVRRSRIPLDGDPEPCLRRYDDRLRQRQGRGHRHGNAHGDRQDRLAHPGAEGREEPAPARDREGDTVRHGPGRWPSARSFSSSGPRSDSSARLRPSSLPSGSSSPTCRRGCCPRSPCRWPWRSSGWRRRTCW